MSPIDYQVAYETAEAARIDTAAKLATATRDLRRERALRAHPVLNTGNLVDLVRGDTDESHAENALELATVLLTHRSPIDLRQDPAE